MTLSLNEMNFHSKLREVNTKNEIYTLNSFCNFINEYALMLETNYKKYLELQPSIKDIYISSNSKKESVTIEGGMDINQFLDEKLSEGSMIKQGYLYVRKMGKKKKMRRRWFVASNGVLHIYKSWKNEKEKERIELMLCSVKHQPVPLTTGIEIQQEGDSSELKETPKFIFQLISPPNLENPLGLQLEIATTMESELKDWVKVIEKSIKFKLEEQQKNKLKIFNRNFLKEIQKLSEANSFCADCNCENPEWASINLGLIVCDQCVGVHRNMGTHVSRMRSLTIDIWEEEQFELMKAMGNSVSNKWWEFSLPLEQKINKTVDRETRNNFIFDKYLKRKWVDPFSSFYSKSQLLSGFLDACTNNDIPSIAKFFVDDRLSLNQVIDNSIFQNEEDELSTDPLSSYPPPSNNSSPSSNNSSPPSPPSSSSRKSSSPKRSSPRFSSDVFLNSSPLYSTESTPQRTSSRSSGGTPIKKSPRSSGRKSLAVIHNANTVTGVINVGNNLTGNAKTNTPSLNNRILEHNKSVYKIRDKRRSYSNPYTLSDEDFSSLTPAPEDSNFYFLFNLPNNFYFLISPIIFIFYLISSIVFIFNILFVFSRVF